MRRIKTVHWLAPLAVFAVPMFVPAIGFCQSSESSNEKKTVEPVFRVSKLSDASRSTLERELLQPKAVAESVTEAAIESTTQSGHVLDRAIEMAYQGLGEMRSTVNDYTAIMVKRERVNGVVGEAEYMKVKIRCPRSTQTTKTPFSVYMKFLRPKGTAGREVIWVDGKNNNQLCVHEGRGIISMKEFNLDPTGWIAMKGNRYPIYEAGIENLIVKLIEKAERDRNAGPCIATYREGAMINKRACTMIELIHEEKKAPFEFYKAQVFIDQELNVPVRYAAWDWPTCPGGQPSLMEEYTYVNIATNVGLTDLDFDPSNPDYHYPNR